jgi:hypothetical protein
MMNIVCAWLVFHHQIELALSSAQHGVLQCFCKEIYGRKEVVGGCVRRTSLPTCFPLPKIGKLHSQKGTQFNRMKRIYFFVYKNVLMTFAGRIEVYGPPTVIWTALT